MFKFIKRLFIILILLLIVCIVAAYFYLGSIVKYGVEKFVPPVTGTAVTLQNVDISLFKGKFALNNLQIANPAGYAQPNIFSLGEVTVDMDIPSLLKDTIVIKEVRITEPKISLEATGQGLNINVLRNNINSYIQKNSTSAQQQAEKAKPEKTEKAGKSVVLEKLNINGATVYLGAFGKGVEIPLPNIERKDIGKKSKSSMGQTIASVLNVLSIESLKSYVTYVKNGGMELLSSATDAAKEIADKAQEKIGQAAADATQKASEKISETANSAKEAIKNWF